MKLPDISTKIKRLASLDMPVEALKALFLDLAVELDLEEARLSKDRARKPHGISKETPRNIHGNGVEFPASRVLDNNPSFLTSGKKEESKNPLITPPISKPLEPPGFAEWFEVYPKRAGGRDRLGAAKSFGAQRKRGISFETLMDGARRYAAFCDATEKTGTEFVKQARTWLNKSSWKEEYETSQHRPKSGSIAGSAAIIDAAFAAEEAAIREEEQRQGISQPNVDELPRLRQVN